jgi:hypothetical protein
MVSMHFLLSALCVHASFAANIKEYVALGPNGGGSTGTSKLEWVSVEYPEGVSSAKDVSLSLVKSTVPELGSWFGLNTGPLALTAKIVDDTMYALYDKDSNEGGGCCADELHIYKRDGGGKFTTIQLNPVVQKALNVTEAHASHTFDVVKLKDGSVAALFQVKYTEAGTGGDSADAIVGMKVSDGSILKTADGNLAFDMFKEAGTMSTATKDSRFKIQYYKDTSTSGGGGEQFHGNGVLQFTAKSGITYLAFTHRMDAEAIVFKDPFTYTSKEGGGKIVQRFGTPYAYNEYGVSSTRYFGLNPKAAAFATGVHNVWYTAASASLSGKESISLFVNSQGTKAAAYEFTFNPVDEGSAKDTGDDKVFDVPYVNASCTFLAQAQGGARTIGKGVFLVMSGADSTGLEVVDTAGNTKTQAYTLGGTAPLYDPFIRVMAKSSEVIV